MSDKAEFLTGRVGVTKSVCLCRHQIIRKLFDLKTSNPELATLLAKQLFANAMVGAGLSDDPRMLLTTMNELLGKALEKH